MYTSVCLLMLLHVFPYDDGATDVHIQRPNYSKLRDFHTVVNMMNKLHRYPLSLISVGTNKWPQNNDTRATFVILAWDASYFVHAWQR